MPAHPTEATPAHPVEATWDDDVRAGDPLRFPGYERPEAESVLTGRTRDYAFVVGRFDVLGGSMGAAAGERIVRAYARAADAGLPFVAFTASGGARMQEGMVALIQMARTSRAAAAHGAEGLLSLAVHRSPTTGGAFASYGSLCDLRAAVDGATIGFAGPRVVEQLTGSPLPPDSHTAASAHASPATGGTRPMRPHAPRNPSRRFRARTRCRARNGTFARDSSRRSGGRCARARARCSGS